MPVKLVELVLDESGRVIDPKNPKYLRWDPLWGPQIFQTTIEVRKERLIEFIQNCFDDLVSNLRTGAVGELLYEMIDRRPYKRKLNKFCKVEKRLNEGEVALGYLLLDSGGGINRRYHIATIQFYRKAR